MSFNNLNVTVPVTNFNTPSTSFYNQLVNNSSYIYNLTLSNTVDNQNINYIGLSSYTGPTSVSYVNEINNIPHIGSKPIPINSYDIITYEDIQDGDILINFNRDDNKTEYDYGAYYKESSLRFILDSKKNPFTMKNLDMNSLVKYTVKY